MVSKKPRMPMPVSERAKQFAPFSPLSGLGRRLSEIEKQRVEQIQRAEESEEAVNRKLLALQPGQTVTAIYYDPIERQYIQASGRFVRLDRCERVLYLGEERISLAMLYDLGTEESACTPI